MREQNFSKTTNFLVKTKLYYYIYPKANMAIDVIPIFLRFNKRPDDTKLFYLDQQWKTYVGLHPKLAFSLFNCLIRF